MRRSGSAISKLLLTVAAAASSSFVNASVPATTRTDLFVEEPSAVITEQQRVTGVVALPLISIIGATGGAISLPLSQSLEGLGKIRIGTEAAVRDIARVASRAGLQRASFTIIGNRDQVISITVPQEIPLSQLNGDGEIAFSPLTTYSGGSGGSDRLTASADGLGTLAFDVGGRIASAPSATAGDYAGVLRVTVQYN